MSVHTASISLRTRGKGTYEITSQVEAIVSALEEMAQPETAVSSAASSPS